MDQLTQTTEERLYAVSTKLSALNELSSEVNRRLGVVEKQLEARIAEAVRLAIVEQNQGILAANVKDLNEDVERMAEKKSAWWTWGIQFLVSTIGAAVILWGLHKLGMGA